MIVILLGQICWSPFISITEIPSSPTNLNEKKTLKTLTQVLKELQTLYKMTTRMTCGLIWVVKVVHGTNIVIRQVRIAQTDTSLTKNPTVVKMCYDMQI